MKRFFDKVLVAPSGCHLWTAARDPQGYGRAYFRKRAGSLAHRVAWELANGPIPAGLKVLHRCDNPPCVNPDHLFLGTQRENVADCKAKGRTPKGVKNARAKLTPAQVIEIRELYAAGGILQRELADRFGVGRRTIGRAIQGLYWSHVD